MFEISVAEEFDAAHYLRGYQGKCEALHGHRYRVRVTLACEKLNDIGLAYDFTVLKGHLRELLGKYDHTCLNDVPPFDELNASAENIAVTVYEWLKPKVAAPGITVKQVEVWESPNSRVTYRPD
jgi:6-pyruvoyltetrahydropterin/6-carboxytetrahydropterin synthase